jgi:hypothetical protein
VVCNSASNFHQEYHQYGTEIIALYFQFLAFTLHSHCIQHYCSYVCYCYGYIYVSYLREDREEDGETKKILSFKGAGFKT